MVSSSGAAPGAEDAPGARLAAPGAWRLPRGVRATAFSAVCVALAAAAHTSMSMDSLSLATLVAGFAGVAGATWLLAGKSRNAWAAGGWMVTAQGALHLLFSSLAGMPGTPSATVSPTADQPGMPGMAHMHAVSGAVAAASGGAHARPDMSWGMLLGHLLAALGCALLMRDGEAALGRVIDLLRALAFAISLLPVPLRPVTSGPPVRRRRPRRERSPRLLRLSYALIRRGPPYPLPAM